MMKDEGRKMKEDEKDLQNMNESLSLRPDFPFSIRHFSFFISGFIPFILYPSSFNVSQCVTD